MNHRKTLYYLNILHSDDDIGMKNCVDPSEDLGAGLFLAFFLSR